MAISKILIVAIVEFLCIIMIATLTRNFVRVMIALVVSHTQAYDTIKAVDSNKCLGCIIDKILSFKLHLDIN